MTTWLWRPGKLGFLVPWDCIITVNKKGAHTPGAPILATATRGHFYIEQLVGFMLVGPIGRNQKTKSSETATILRHSRGQQGQELSLPVKDAY